MTTREAPDAGAADVAKPGEHLYEAWRDALPVWGLNARSAFEAGYAAAQARAAALEELLRDLRTYTADLEGRYATFVITRPYMAQMPDGAEALKERLDAAIGPFARAALAPPGART